MIISWPPKYDNSYLPPHYSKYWFKDIETMDPEEREEKIIFPKLKAQLQYAYEKSLLYRKKWDEAGIRIEEIPFLTKDENRQDQKENPPFSSNLCVSIKDLTRIQGTSGTTGKPTVFGISREDMERIAEAHARAMWGFGMRQEDIVFIGSFFSAFIGGAGGHY